MLNTGSSRAINGTPRTSDETIFTGGPHGSMTTKPQSLSTALTCPVDGLPVFMGKRHPAKWCVLISPNTCSGSPSSKRADNAKMGESRFIFRNEVTGGTLYSSYSFPEKLAGLHLPPTFGEFDFRKIPIGGQITLKPGVGKVTQVRLSLSLNGRRNF